MGQLELIPVKTNEPREEKLQVNKPAGKIHGGMAIIRFQDKDTKQFISFCPSLDISGYGLTKEKAFEMLRFSISEYFGYIIKLPLNEIEEELNKLGWKRNRLFRKQYSKSFVDINGELQNFNAIEGTVERFRLEAA